MAIITVSPEELRQDAAMFDQASVWLAALLERTDDLVEGVPAGCTITFVDPYRRLRPALSHGLRILQEGSHELSHTASYFTCTGLQKAI